MQKGQSRTRKSEGGPREGSAFRRVRLTRGTPFAISTSSLVSAASILCALVGAALLVRLWHSPDHDSTLAAPLLGLALLLAAWARSKGRDE